MRHKRILVRFCIRSSRNIMIGMKEQNRSVKQMKAGPCVSALRWVENFRSSPPRPLFASARMVGEMQCPLVVGLHTLLNGTHWKKITKRKARVPSMLMTMKEIIIFDSLGWCVPLITRRMNKHTEVLISPVAIVACISATVVHFEASDSVGSTYIVCLPNPRCVCLAFVAPPKIQTAYEYVLIRQICWSSEARILNYQSHVNGVVVPAVGP